MAYLFLFYGKQLLCFLFLWKCKNEKSESLRSIIQEGAFINVSATTRKSKQKLMLSKIRFSLPKNYY